MRFLGNDWGYVVKCKMHVIEFAGLLEADFKVLDIGCGPGNVAKQLCAVKRLEITGIDLSSEMLAIAKVSVPEGTFQLQDCRQAKFLAEYFDAVVLSLVLFIWRMARRRRY